MNRNWMRRMILVGGLAAGGFAFGQSSSTSSTTSSSDMGTSSTIDQSKSVQDKTAAPVSPDLQDNTATGSSTSR